jgi:hypothetical protein
MNHDFTHGISVAMGKGAAPAVRLPQLSYKELLSKLK